MFFLPLLLLLGLPQASGPSRRGVGRALAAPPGVAFPGLVEALRCPTDPGRWGSLVAGEKLSRA